MDGNFQMLSVGDESEDVVDSGSRKEMKIIIVNNQRSTRHDWMADAE